jgi:hypothetical protein
MPIYLLPFYPTVLPPPPHIFGTSCHARPGERYCTGFYYDLCRTSLRAGLDTVASTKRPPEDLFQSAEAEMYCAKSCFYRQLHMCFSGLTYCR